MENCCRLVDLQCKEVINICDGKRLGFVYDVLLNECTGKIHAIMVPGTLKFFGLFGREDEYIIEWHEINRIGDDIIFVEIKTYQNAKPPRRKKWFFN